MSRLYGMKELGDWSSIARPTQDDLDMVRQLRAKPYFNGEPTANVQWWNLNEGWIERRVAGAPSVRFYGKVELSLDLDRRFGCPGLSDWLSENDISFRMTPNGAFHFDHNNERDLFILRWAK